MRRDETGGGGGALLLEPTGDFLLDQLASTNNVAPQHRGFSWFCGGINCHVEHHLFPAVAPELLPLVAPVVEDFAKRHGLPYHSYDSPVALWRDHFRFLLLEKPSMSPSPSSSPTSAAAGSTASGMHHQQ